VKLNRLFLWNAGKETDCIAYGEHSRDFDDGSGVKLVVEASREFGLALLNSKGFKSVLIHRLMC
jgi:hypothetical protein